MSRAGSVHLRLATERDAGGVLAIYGPIVTSTVISFELDVPSEGEMAGRIRARHPAYPWIVATAGDDIVGYAYAGPFSGRPAYDWSVETSVYVAEAARGRSVGKGLYASLFDILAAQGYRQALAGIALPNPASVALHERAGFAPIGMYRAVGWKFGSWHDVGWWQRGLADGETGPPGARHAVTELPAPVLRAALRHPDHRDPEPLR